MIPLTTPTSCSQDVWALVPQSTALSSSPEHALSGVSSEALGCFDATIAHLHLDPSIMPTPTSCGHATTMDASLAMDTSMSPSLSGVSASIPPAVVNQLKKASRFARISKASCAEHFRRCGDARLRRPSAPQFPNACNKRARRGVRTRPADAAAFGPTRSKSRELIACRRRARLPSHRCRRPPDAAYTL